jgi:hypothetical protein
MYAVIQEFDNRASTILFVTEDEQIAKNAVNRAYEELNIAATMPSFSDLPPGDKETLHSRIKAHIEEIEEYTHKMEQFFTDIYYVTRDWSYYVFSYQKVEVR